MGTLYYFQKEGPEEELFALNKVYHYVNERAMREWSREFVTLEQFAPNADEWWSRWMDREAGSDLREWSDLIFARLSAWAKFDRIRVLSEHDIGENVHVGLTYDQHIDKITGSAHDSDYEDDGTTYKRGSAW